MQFDPERHLTTLFNYIENVAEGEGIFQTSLSKSQKGDEELLRKGAASGFAIPAEFSPKDYLAFLITIDCELEHGLMIMYLYAAYSLGGPQVPEEHRETVRKWQEIILGIAKEEMGHFISVNNVLRCIGAPLNFGRQDYPWDSMFYPFPFKLEPLSIESIAKYVYAESPEDWIYSGSQEAEEIREILGIPPKGSGLKGTYESRNYNSELGEPISKLFKAILDLVQNTDLIPDDTFQSGTYPFQAKFDEWGRGYSGGQRGNHMKGNPKGAPDVLVAPLLSRTDTINSLNTVAEQGEAVGAGDVGTLPSHFERFLKVYTELRDMNGAFEPSRNVAVNPYVKSTGTPEFGDIEPEYNPADGQESNQEQDGITHPESVLWANLLNVRYRMLLTFLAHSFQLDGGLNGTGNFRPRGLVINSTFGEMYNIRSISHALVQLPLNRFPGSTKKAGPPFTLPYSMDLPLGEANIWRLHLELIEASVSISLQLRTMVTGRNETFLNSLVEADALLAETIEPLTHSTQPSL